jgi:hypothetical protein
LSWAGFFPPPFTDLLWVVSHALPTITSGRKAKVKSALVRPPLKIVRY